MFLLFPPRLAVSSFLPAADFAQGLLLFLDTYLRSRWNRHLVLFPGKEREAVQFASGGKPEKGMGEKCNFFIISFCGTGGRCIFPPLEKIGYFLKLNWAESEPFLSAVQRKRKNRIKAENKMIEKLLPFSPTKFLQNPLWVWFVGKSFFCVANQRRHKLFVSTWKSLFSCTFR